MFSKVCVIGLGYIGLPTLGVLCKKGKDIVGVDIKEDLILKLKENLLKLSEPGVEELLYYCGNTPKYSTVPEEADVFVITVQTPLLGKEKSPDLTYVKQAMNNILPFLKKGNLVVIESTCPPRTTEDVIAPIINSTGLISGEDIYLSYCPERVLPGKLLKELIYNHRVIGGINEISSKMAGIFYSSFVEGNLYFTDATTAEMVKLMENTYRDVNIALVNRLAIMCEELGVDAWKIIELANHHPRVNLHSPGPGVGGHCIAIDPWFIANSVSSSPLITLAREINNFMPTYVVKKIMEYLRDNYLYWEISPKVTLLGMSYKGNTDDCRESPALEIMASLQEAGIIVEYYDPYIRGGNLLDAVENSYLLVILADHDRFKTVCPHQLGELMLNKAVLDTKNCINKLTWEKAGFDYFLLGDGTKTPVTITGGFNE